MVDDPSLLSGAGTKSDGGVEGHAATPIWVSADRKVDATSCSIQEGSHSGQAGIKPGPSDPSPGSDVSLSAPVGEPVHNLHPKTANLVRRFSNALAKKLRLAEVKYGFGDGWAEGHWERECLAHFHSHIEKGDPLDVAAYCAFMWHHRWITYPSPAPAVGPDVREAARACADDLINIVEAAQRAANRTGNTFVLDRERVAGMIAGKFFALTRPLGGFVQGSIARKQSTDPEGSSRTETAGGES